MTITITLDVIKRPGCAPTAIPPTHRAESLAADLRFQADREPEPERARQMRAEADEMLELDKRVREACAPYMDAMEWTITPYTQQQKLDAERAATTWRDGKPSTDWGAVKMALASAALGSNVGELPPGIAGPLIDEIIARCEPSALKLDFLLGPPTSSGAIQADDSMRTASSQRS